MSQVKKQIKKRVVARVIGVPEEVHKRMSDISAQSKTHQEEPMSSLMKEGQVIEPPFDPLVLTMLPEESTELNQCIEAMEVNIEGFGFRFVPRFKEGDIPEGIDKEEVDQERIDLENFFGYVADEDSYVKFRRKMRRDLELTGNSYFEIIRGDSGKIHFFNHIPSHQMRLGIQEPVAQKTQFPMYRKQKDGSVKIKKVTKWKRFRKFVQVVSARNRAMKQVGSPRVVWFKQFGDRRMYDNRTGEIVIDKPLEPQYRANEIVHFSIYSGRSPYGLPRFIGNLLSIFGDRAAEEINFMTFKNNNIPSMVVTVSNGQLTQETVDRVTEFTETAIQSSKNRSKFLILEAEPAFEGDEEESGGNTRINIQPLTGDQHNDALFVNYSDKNQEKIRRCFRLPPLLVGRADDYTRNVAETSRKLADEQVFAPERYEFDSWHNRILFPELGVVHHLFKSNTPNTTDNTELVDILAGSEKSGGITPRIARKILEDILGEELPPFPEDFPADVPFSMTMAEAVKNKADPSEPGQQVTALKMVDALTSSSSDRISNRVIDTLLDVRDKLQKRFESEVSNG